MRRIKTVLLLLVMIFSMVSCSEKQNFEKPNVSVKDIQKDFKTWWKYHNENISLSRDFKGIDMSGEVMSKNNFLKKLMRGEYIPIKLALEDNFEYYKLYGVASKNRNDISGTIQNIAQQAYKNFQLENTQFPKFEFVDINGRTFNNENTLGYTIILKCWFIGCKPCIDEFPALNRLEEMYHHRGDVLFISLSPDSMEKLKAFLAIKQTNYFVIPDKKHFLDEVLSVSVYPTHMIIDNKGVIKKVVNSFDELIFELESSKILGPGYMKTNPPPPPPPSK